MPNTTTPAFVALDSITIPKNFAQPLLELSPLRKGALALFVLGVMIFIIGGTGAFTTIPALYSLGSLGLATFGALLYILPLFSEYKPGIHHNGIMFSRAQHRGAAAWIIGVGMTGFYVLLYWYAEYLQHCIRAADPLSFLLRGKAADQWFLYGTLYTLAVIIMGVRMIAKYRHSRYHIIRTLSVVFFQLLFAYLIPAWLQMMNQPEFYFTYFWPLKYDYLNPLNVQYFLASPNHLMVFMIIWGMIMTFVATPILTYFFGKRWYCSWVCGCGGLAETLGDPFRQNSDKSLKAWKIERWMIHSVLIFVTTMTGLLWINSAMQGAVLGEFSLAYSKTYSFLIGSLFSGVVGTGFYPIMGSRVWCRFGCPMAAVLGIFQRRFSRFRITTNGGQCISCGNCSTYCEMGIDVRSYAQRGEDIVRASCVGCGVCSAVCPRGVLALENGK
ncbi:MAG: 4Fe-4S binding protein [Candidatus Kapabacteria bacterium]|jgi:Pyruvate/2-oxoacid:ferredoxin oxidoreductase delta subunit|nr:4Fe-4S binding protein [Candidatus Kapabacteria bacterium]